jgi:hypothetical protein
MLAESAEPSPSFALRRADDLGKQGLQHRGNHRASIQRSMESDRAARAKPIPAEIFLLARGEEGDVEKRLLVVQR